CRAGSDAHHNRHADTAEVEHVEERIYQMDSICPSASEPVIDETIGQEQGRIGHFACRRCDVRCPAMSATTVATHVELPVSVALRRPQAGGCPFRVRGLSSKERTQVTTPAFADQSATSGTGDKARGGDAFPTLELTATSGQLITIPDTAGNFVHLQLRRFAGCPICNLHLRSLVARHGEIRSHGIREDVVFHSTATELAKYEAELPFPLIADPERELYRRLGVERRAG